jgi:hypothetical protein
MSVVLLLSTRHAICPDRAASGKPGALCPSLDEFAAARDLKRVRIVRATYGYNQ